MTYNAVLQDQGDGLLECRLQACPQVRWDALGLQDGLGHETAACQDGQVMHMRLQQSQVMHMLLRLRR